MSERVKFHKCSECRNRDICKYAEIVVYFIDHNIKDLDLDEAIKNGPLTIAITCDRFEKFPGNQLRRGVEII